MIHTPHTAEYARGCSVTSPPTARIYTILVNLNVIYTSAQLSLLMTVCMCVCLI